MSKGFTEEVQQLYDKLLESCAENNFYIDESFCAEQKTQSYESNTTCEQYLPCTQTQVFSVYVDTLSGCHTIGSKFIFIWITITLIFLNSYIKL